MSKAVVAERRTTASHSHVTVPVNPQFDDFELVTEESIRTHVVFRITPSQNGKQTPIYTDCF